MIETIEIIDAIAYYRCPICGTTYTTLGLAMECRDQGRYESGLKVGALYEWKEKETKDGYLKIEGRFLRVGYKNRSTSNNIRSPISFLSIKSIILDKVVEHDWYLAFDLTTEPQLCEYKLYRLPHDFKEIEG